MLALAMLICMYNNYTAVNNPYYKACFIKVVEVVVLDDVLRVYVGH